MPTIELVVLSRRGCDLCEEMIAVVREVIAGQPARLEVRDIDADPELRARHDEEIPLLLVNGRLAFKYRVSAGELRRRLRAEEARGWRRFLARSR